jgi:apolipoprotein N-acyltransferase
MFTPLLLAAASAVLLIASFPPVGMWPLAWVAFVPLFFALHGEGARRPALTGFVFGFVFFLGTVYWVVHSMFFYGGVGLASSVPVMLLLVAYLAIYPALFGLFFRLSGIGGTAARHGGSFWTQLTVPAAWTALEFARGSLFTGFPWVVAGYTQAAWPPLVQVADIIGVWGISFLLLLVNWTVFLALRAVVGRDRTFPVREAVVAAVILTLTVVYGFMKIGAIDDRAASWKAVRAAVLQGNIDQSVKWDRSFRESTIDIYAALTHDAAGDGARLIVWPETAVPFYLASDTEESAVVRGIADGAGAYVLTGSPSYRFNLDTGRPEFLNSAYLLGPAGEISGRFDKVHLVPFGEYVPFKRLLFFVDKLTEGVGDFVAGPGPYPIAFDSSGIGVLICYEAIFPRLAAAHVNNGAGVLVNITNDAWFGRTSAPYQHFQMSVLRAVENRVFLLRAANTGISAVVDPAGRVINQTALFEQAAVVEDIRLREGRPTFYTARGDLFAYGFN